MRIRLVYLKMFGMFAALVLVAGCGKLWDFALRDTVDPDAGSVSVAGITAPVTVRRDDLGIPVIQAENFHDMVFAEGYVMASDRLAQMTAFSLLGQGRLSEMAGEMVLDMDIYVRALGVPAAARAEFEEMGPELRAALAAFSAGVNSYLGTHADRLPLDFALSGDAPEPWEPMDSIYIAHVFNLGLSFNLHEEIAFLNLAAALGPSRAAWLMPVYPDEPLPFEKAGALESVALREMTGTAEKLSRVYQQLQAVIMPPGTAASNNWAVAPGKTLRHASIIANDTHLPLEQPSLWMLMHLKCPDIDVAGVSIPGVPGIVIGYNGHIAWGITMVMGDNQDVFVEQLKSIDGTTHYLYKGEWLPVEKRRETFRIKGAPDRVVDIEFTRHGPLLNPALQHPPKNLMQPPAMKADPAVGLSVASVVSHPGQSFDGVYRLMQAKDMDGAARAIRRVRSMSLNFIYGDADHIAWQVSGLYPLRKAGRGLLPSPGWTGEYDWTGFADAAEHPFVLDPEEGYLYTANHRTIARDSALMLSSSWYAPERAERIREMLAGNDRHTAEHSVRMQRDRVDNLMEKFKKVLFEPAFLGNVQDSMENWPDAEKIRQAREALDVLRAFNGDMSPDSRAAAVMGLFQDILIHKVFADELGGLDSAAGQSFLTTIEMSYGADQDHLLGRPDSPFWDDVRTPETESKADIFAECLAGAVSEAEDRMGRDRETWRWGRLLTYSWRTQTTQLKKFLPAWQRPVVGLIGRYTDRGPFPAGGSFNTVNVAGHSKGERYDVWLVPAMRMVVDFGLEEPMFLTNSGGQSGNPASPHYDDAIDVWMAGETRPMPFQEEAIKAQYTKEFVLKPAL